MGVALKGKVLAAQLLCGFLHIHPFEWHNAKNGAPIACEQSRLGSRLRNRNYMSPEPQEAPSLHTRS